MQRMMKIIGNDFVGFFMLIACYLVDYSYIKTYFCMPCTEK